jgi:hypothetical protein
MEQMEKQIMLGEMTHAQEQANALYRIREGLATKVRVLVSEKACPVCKQYEGVYPLDDVPEIPFPGCSCPGGCHAVYEPVLDRYGP